MRVTCPICKSSPDATKKANVAKFLQIYAGLESYSTYAHLCKKCEFVWHELGLTDNQASKLYKDYRGLEYNEVRISIEPEYSNIAREFDDFHSAHYRERSGELDAIFRNSKFRVRRTLDFGGDGLFSNWIFPNAENDFTDLSAGHRLESREFGYDVIFMFHLLEHVNNPIEILQEAWELLNPGGLLITAVPREYDAPLNKHFEITKEFDSAIFNMHEHMNFFSELTLKQMSTISNIPLLTSRLFRWNGLLSFFTRDSEWYDIKSIVDYETRRLENIINDQFNELRNSPTKMNFKRWKK